MKKRKQPDEPAKPVVRCITGQIDSAVGAVPRVSTRLSMRDIIGTWKARWGINRMKYSISPGLYGIGNPDKRSPVLVTANYKMSFDRLRKELTGMDVWIMVLDTKGINVWCAAGKGTFGTDEIVRRIESVDLSRIVTHRTILLPQLGAPGVAAHDVRKQSGFKVVYGPIRSKDIAPFLQANMKATPGMRRVRFSLFDRMVLTPMEMVGTIKIILIIYGALFLLNGFKIISLEGMLPYLGAILLGSVLVPILLPWIPGRSFAFKGWIMGVAWALAVNLNYGLLFSSSPNWKQSLINFLTLPALTSFLSLNFTGASTYTSLSGVVKEMKIAIPLITVSAGAGVVFWILKTFMRF